jgi:hypothetical protein
VQAEALACIVEALAESATRETLASILADDADAYDVRVGRNEQ